MKSQTGCHFLLRSLEAISREAERERADHTAQLLGDLQYIIMLDHELQKQEAEGTGEPVSEQALTQELERFRAKLSRNERRASKAKHPEQGNAAVTRAIAILQSRYSEELSLPVVAGELFLAPGYLSRIFKRETGKNFKEYLTEIRMDQARHLLEGGSLSVGEVARRVGYQDASYFTRVYKKQFGDTPRMKKI